MLAMKKRPAHARVNNRDCWLVIQFSHFCDILQHCTGQTIVEHRVFFRTQQQKVALE